jgi:hypothetical protein
MKKTILTICLSLVVIFSLEAQSIDYSQLRNNWFLIKTNHGKSLDTLTFARDKADSSFTIWNFSRKDTLDISAGYEIEYKPELKNGEKMVVCSSLDYFHYKLEKTNRLLIYTNTKQSGKYRIHQLNKTSMMLIGYSNANPKDVPKTNYYLENSNADSSIFKSDTIALYKKRPAEYSPNIVIDGSKFDFYYNFQTDTIHIVNIKTNEISEKIISKAKQLRGKWEQFDKFGKVKLTFSNDSSVSYKISDKGTLVYLIRIMD